MASLDTVKEQFFSLGYVELNTPKIPRALLWQPDLLFSKDGYHYLVLVKSNNSVPPAYLNRIANVPNENYVPLIIFSQKPALTDEKFILSMGISVGLLLRGKLVNLKIKKRISRKIIKREIGRKLEVIDIFISSKQDIEERNFIADRIEILRKAYAYPFNMAHMIEHDKFAFNKLKAHINEVMGQCEWIIILLEDNYSKIVSYEINKAISTFQPENIFMFVKSTNACQTVWKKELNKIKALESVKYLPYSDLTELEVFLAKAIRRRMNEICKKKRIEIFS